MPFYTFPLQISTVASLSTSFTCTSLKLWQISWMRGALMNGEGRDRRLSGSGFVGYARMRVKFTCRHTVCGYVIFFSLLLMNAVWACTCGGECFNMFTKSWQLTIDCIITVSKGPAPDVTSSVDNETRVWRKSFWRIEKPQSPFSLLHSLKESTWRRYRKTVCSEWEHFLVLKFSHHLCKMHPLRSYKTLLLESVHVESS